MIKKYEELLGIFKSPNTYTISGKSTLGVYPPATQAICHRAKMNKGLCMYFDSSRFVRPPISASLTLVCPASSAS